MALWGGAEVSEVLRLGGGGMARQVLPRASTPHAEAFALRGRMVADRRDGVGVRARGRGLDPPSAGWHNHGGSPPVPWRIATVVVHP